MTYIEFMDEDIESSTEWSNNATDIKKNIVDSIKKYGRIPINKWAEEVQRESKHDQ